MPCNMSFYNWPCFGRTSGHHRQVGAGHLPRRLKYRYRQNKRPFASTSFTRRSVSWKSELPPSIITSPGDMWGSSCSIISSTGAPALIIIMMTRGRLTASTSSSIECRDKILPLAAAVHKTIHHPSSPGKLRLYTATVKPLLSIFRARFSPITARPISPISAFSCSVLFYISLFYQCKQIVQRFTHRRMRINAIPQECVIFSRPYSQRDGIDNLRRFSAEQGTTQYLACFRIDNCFQ